MKAEYCVTIENEMKPHKNLMHKITKKAVERAIAEGIDKDERLADPNDDYFNNLEKYAMARLSFYMCFTC